MADEPIDKLEIKLIEQAAKYVDMMLLGRLRFLQKVYADELVAIQIKELERKLGIPSSSRSDSGSQGQPPKQIGESGIGLTSGAIAQPTGSG